MNESSDEPPLSDRIRSWVRDKAHGSRLNPWKSADHDGPTLPIAKVSSHRDAVDITSTTDSRTTSSFTDGNSKNDRGGQDVPDSGAGDHPPPAPPPTNTDGNGEQSTPITAEPPPGVFNRFWMVTKTILLSSYINALLVFVPVGIALGAINKAGGSQHRISPAAVFAINAVAIIPLAGTLAYATESVAANLGDTLGALLNVSFGNAVELIIFIIALVAGEIRIVQASLLGSILANLLLILGMCFVFGGLRFREQLYNATVTQMSACLLSLSVISLLLPTAFHASFNNIDLADRAVIKVSRGTSVILLLVYLIYLYFQLYSHAYMYKSTPQHLIDEESHPGILAEFMASSSSSDSSSSSSDDSDGSSKSNSTAKRFKRKFRRRKRRKSSASSKEVSSPPSESKSPSISGKVMAGTALSELPPNNSLGPPQSLSAVESGDEADTEAYQQQTLNTGNIVRSRDFETGIMTQGEPSNSTKRSRKSPKKRNHSEKKTKELDMEKADLSLQARTSTSPSVEPTLQINSVPSTGETTENEPRKSFNVLGSSIARPILPKGLSTNFFSHLTPQTHPQEPGQPGESNERPMLRRASSLPDRLNQRFVGQQSVPKQPLPHIMPVTSRPDAPKDDEEKQFLSRTSAIVLLLLSTGLVAICAEFLVDSIDYLVETSGVSQAFIGLIILPIVGNAAEHVTAVTVASKNKMDLAIGVAIGSSIQIALFVTPIIVLLGWCLNTEMSLYFSLFETVSLFVSAFIVGFLIIDGRSNYLEGALLIAAYVIIAVLAYFYPSCENLSTASGPQDASGVC